MAKWAMLWWIWSTCISQIISFDVINNDNIDSEENINPCAFMPYIQFQII